MSDDELEQIAGGSSSSGLESMSEEQLRQISGMPNSVQGRSVPAYGNILQRAADSIRQVVGPHYQAAGGMLNTASFGLPGLAVDKFAPQGFKDFIKPQGDAEQIGRTTGDIGGFFLPGGGPARVGAKAAGLASKAPQFMQKALGTGLRAGAEVGSLSPAALLSDDSSFGTEAMKIGGAAIGAPILQKVIPPTVKAVAGAGKFLGNAPRRLGEIWKSPKVSDELGGKIASLESDISGSQAQIDMPLDVTRGQRIVKQAQESTLGEFKSQASKLSKESRSVFSEAVPGVKEKFSKLKTDTYDKYGKILEEGESEALAKGFSPDEYRAEVIDPVMEMIDRTGADTAAAKRLKGMFKVEEGLSDAAYKKADEKMLNKVQSLDSIEKIKALRSSLYKQDTQDFIQSGYSDLHQKFVGKYSPTVAEANKSYGPMAQSIRFGNKTLKPMDSHQIKNVADILQKQRGGKLDETTSAYLNTLKTGKGPFKGSDVTELSNTHKATLDAIESDIAKTDDLISKLESQHNVDISTIRRGKYDTEVRDSNLLQKIASKKSQKEQLSLLKAKVDRDVKSREALKTWGLISGLGTLGLGAVGKVLSKTRTD